MLFSYWLNGVLVTLLTLAAVFFAAVAFWAVGYATKYLLKDLLPWDVNLKLSDPVQKSKSTLIGCFVFLLLAAPTAIGKNLDIVERIMSLF